MRSIIFVILFLFIGADFWAQKKSWTDTTYYASGKTESVTYWIDNVRKSIAYFPEYKNVKTHEYFFSYTGKEDSWVYYFDNGVKSSEYTTLDNVIEGPAYTYYNTGNKRSERNYHKNEVTGKEVVYYMSGKKKMEIEYKKGKRDGQIIEYYENGKKKWFGENRKNKISGKRMFYDETGKAFNGKFISYHENGKKEREVNCVNGKPDGELYLYDYKENVIAKITFVKGLAEGNYYVYNKYGKATSVELYEKGEFVKVLEEVKVKEYGIKESVGN